MSHYLIPDWPAPSAISACTTLRFDGFSEGPYAGFNLSAREDDPGVSANRQRLLQELGLKTAPVWLNQVHGIKAVLAETSQPSPAADAAYARTPGVPAAVLTADCLPVLLCNQAGSEVAAIHAGWRGLLAGVIEATIAKLQSPATTLLAWLGPAIGPKHFEVGAEVYSAFVQHSPQAATAFQPSGDRWLANLYQLAEQRLAQCKVTQIYGGNFCTYADSQRFYSFRRDQGVTGRMASLIWIN